MWQYLAVVAVAVIATETLGFSLAAGEAKAWNWPIKKQERPDVFGEYSDFSFVKSEDEGLFLNVGESFQEHWAYPERYISISGPCSPFRSLKEEILVVKIWIDGWREDIMANFRKDKVGFACSVNLLADDKFNKFGKRWQARNNLVRRINHGNMMQVKWRGRTHPIRFDISGETRFLQGEAVKGQY